MESNFSLKSINVNIFFHLTLLLALFKELAREPFLKEFVIQLKAIVARRVILFSS